MIEGEDIAQRHRPRRFKDLVGQDEAVKVLTGMFDKGKVPHALLLTGGSGCGKTTVARIVARKIGCSEMDYHEVNTADFRGIDMIRDIRNRCKYAPAGGTARAWLIDEAHQLSADAQEALLKLLEDQPRHAYFMLATTLPQKLKDTIHTRCTEVRMRTVGVRELAALVQKVAVKEDAPVSDDVALKIAECADGSPRKALVLLGSTLVLGTEEEQLESIARSQGNRQANFLGNILLYQPAWGAVCKTLRELDEDPETVRRGVLGYANSVLIGGKAGKNAAQAIKIIEAFQYNLYESGKAGLTLACYRVVHGG